jgi:hypothetical protein
VRSPDYYKRLREAELDKTCSGCQHNFKKEHKVRDHPTEQLYYVQQTNQVVGNCMLLWGIASQGYTTEVSKAGLYTKEDVQGMRKTDIGWPKEVIERNVTTHIRADTIRHEENVETVKGKWG